MRKLIELTKVGLFLARREHHLRQPDYIMMIGSVLGDLDSQRRSSPCPIGGALLPHLIYVKQSMREVLEKIDAADPGHE